MNVIQEGCCPTCGSKLVDQKLYDEKNRTFIANGAAVRFTKAEADVFEAIWRTRNRGAYTSLESLANAAWADRVDGGPSCFNTLSVQIIKLRRKLAPLGYTVTHNFGQPKQGYRIVKMEAAA